MVSQLVLYNSKVFLQELKFLKSWTYWVCIFDVVWSTSCSSNIQIRAAKQISSTTRACGTLHLTKINCISCHEHFFLQNQSNMRKGMKRPIVGRTTSSDKNANSFGKFLAHYSLLQEAGCSYTAEVVALCRVGMGGCLAPGGPAACDRLWPSCPI